MDLYRYDRAFTLILLLLLSPDYLSSTSLMFLPVIIIAMIGGSLSLILSLLSKTSTYLSSRLSLLYISTASPSLLRSRREPRAFLHLFLLVR